MEKYINKSLLKESIIYSFIFGMIAHGFMYLNADFTHDSLYGIVGIPEIDTMNISIGRFLLPQYLKIRGYVASPLLIGVIGIAFIALSTYLLIDLFEIKSNYTKLLLSAIMVTNYTVTITNATYINDSDPYYASLFFAVLAVYALVKDKKIGVIVGIVSTFLSIGLYQAYFQVSILLLMIIVTMRLLNNEDYKQVFLDALKIAAYMLVGVIAYYVVYKITLSINGISASTGYNGIPELSKYFDLKVISGYFKNSIEYEVAWFCGKNHHHQKLIFITNLMLVISMLWGMISISKEKKTKSINLALMTLAIVLMPVGMNFLCILSQGYEHEVMTFSFFIIYVLILKIIEVFVTGEKKNIVNGCITLITSVLCGYMIFSNCIYSNEMYLEKHLVVENTLSTMTRVLDRIEQTDGYEVGKTPVVFIGTPIQSKLEMERYGFLNTGEATNVYSAITYYETYYSYFERYLGYPINLLSIVDEYNYGAMKEVKDMPTFPDKGSVAFVGDTLVVKMCEWGD